MARRLYPHKRVRYWYAYDLEEICALFVDKGLHIQTVRKWTRNGLKTIGKGKPALVYGQDLIDFLKKQNDGGKCQVPFDQFYCMKCKDARPAFQSRAKFIQQGQSLRLQAQCRTCKSRMNKAYRLTDYPQLKRIFHQGDVLELNDCVTSPDKAHIGDTEQAAKNESSFQADLFGKEGEIHA